MTDLLAFGIIAFMTTAVALLILFICYRAFYKISINKKLKNNESTAHVSMFPTESFGKAAVIILSLIFVISTLCSLSKIESNTNQVEMNLNNRINSLSSELNEIKEEIKIQNSLFSDFAVEYGEINTTDNTVEMKINCTPKTYSKDTKIKLNSFFESYDFTLNSNGTYTTECEMPLFSPVDDITITLETNGITSVQKLENSGFYGALCMEALPCFEVDSIKQTIERKKFKFELNIENLINNGDFSDIELIKYTNGKETERQKITDSYYYSNFSIPKKTNFDFVLTAKDKYGYIHKLVLYADNPDNFTEMESICDKDGNVLYGVK